MAGLTMGTAMAANYPEPFVSGSTANSAIVYGTGSGVSDLDQIAANAIQADLGENLPATGSTSFSGGDVFTLDKTSDGMNIGDTLASVYADLDEEEMTIFLAEDQEYVEGDIDETYDQKITLGTVALSFFEHSDYNSKTPTLGFHFDNTDTVLSYELTFDDPITMTDMNDTSLPLMGKEYYVLTAKAGEINLLDTAETHLLAKGDSITIDGKVISPTYISSTASEGAMFTVDGVATDKIAENSYKKLLDGSYLVVTNMLYEAKESGVSQVEFALGKGKIDLVTTEEVEFNDVDESGLSVTLTEGTAGLLDSITITWASDDDTFLTESNALIMPGFETIKLGLEGISFPSDPETILFENGETLNLAIGSLNFPIMWRNETDYQALGEENYLLVAATSEYANYTSPEKGNMTGGLDLGDDNRFIVTVLDDDLGDIEQYYYQVNSIKNSSGTIEVVLDDKIGTGDITFTSLTTKDKGTTTFELVAINSTGSDGRVYINFTSSSGTVTYDKVVSDEGLIIDFPLTAEEDATITLIEADREGDLNEGSRFTLTVGNTSNDLLHIKSNNLTYEKETSDKYWTGYLNSALATKVETDKGGDEYDLEITYYASEVKATVNVASADAEIVSEGVAEIMVVKDTEVSSVATKNLIVVGGSCINSAAAALVGGAYCGAAWTTATGVGSGQFLIKSYASSSLTSGIALLVAGYEKEDTTNAATYLRTKVNLDTSAAYKGTSATSATLVVE